MENLPIELIESIFDWVALPTLRLRIQFVSRKWRSCAMKLVSKRLHHAELRIRAMEADSAHSARDSLSSAKAICMCLVTEPAAAAEAANDPSTITSPPSNFMTAIPLTVRGYDVHSGTLVFKPLGIETFGIWVDHIGFLSLVSMYNSDNFVFHPSSPPKLHLWFHATSSSASSSFSLSSTTTTTHAVSTTSDTLRHRPIKALVGALATSRFCTSLNTLPNTSMPLESFAGRHIVDLRDRLGHVGSIHYNVEKADMDISETNSNPNPVQISVSEPTPHQSNGSSESHMTDRVDHQPQSDLTNLLDMTLDLALSNLPTNPSDDPAVISDTATNTNITTAESRSSDIDPHSNVSARIDCVRVNPQVLFAQPL